MNSQYLEYQILNQLKISKVKPEISKTIKNNLFYQSNINISSNLSKDLSFLIQQWNQLVSLYHNNTSQAFYLGNCNQTTSKKT